MAIGPACFSKKGWVSQACFVRGPGAVIGIEYRRIVLGGCSLIVCPDLPVFSTQAQLSCFIWKLLHLWLWCYLTYSKEWRAWKRIYSVFIWTCDTGAFRLHQCFCFECVKDIHFCYFRVQTWHLACERSHASEVNFEQNVTTQAGQSAPFKLSEV